LLVYWWILLVFVIGAAVGSFLNVAISRLPLEKSLLWPSSRCGNCLQTIRCYDNLPLLSYLRLRGRCRNCGARFSIRYFIVELATGLGFAGLFYLEVVVNIHEWPNQRGAWAVQQGFFPIEWWLGFGYHAILFSLLMVVSMCDLDCFEIPIQVTLTGAALGLLGSLFFAWPWPWTPAQAVPFNVNMLNPWQVPQAGLKAGLQPWPLWGPLPQWLAPGGNWQTGLATAIAGGLAGTFLLRAIAFLAGKGLGKEAMGLGDADLMMMAGCFLGWQPVVIAFFVSAVPGLVFGALSLTLRKGSEIPFGPSLAVGLLGTMLSWRWIGPYVQPILFWDTLLLILAPACMIFMFVLTFLLRLAQR